MFLKNISTLHNKGFICCSTKWALQSLISLLDRSNKSRKSTHTHNREIRPAITQRQCEDIPGMLLFDSNLLCVDSLIDADDLGEEQMRKMNNIIQCLREKKYSLLCVVAGVNFFHNLFRHKGPEFATLIPVQPQLSRLEVQHEAASEKVRRWPES